MEITNNDELAISRQLAKGQSTNPRYYLCYCDYEIDFLANGQRAIWLTQQEMAYQVDSGRPEDGRPCHVSAFRKKSLYNEDSSPTTGQRCGWQNIEEIDFNNTEKQGNKSYPGNVIEHVWFDHPADNISAPDFPEAEVELKVSQSISRKARMVLLALQEKG